MCCVRVLPVARPRCCFVRSVPVCPVNRTRQSIQAQILQLQQQIVARNAAAQVSAASVAVRVGWGCAWHCRTMVPSLIC